MHDPVGDAKSNPCRILGDVRSNPCKISGDAMSNPSAKWCEEEMR